MRSMHEERVTQRCAHCSLPDALHSVNQAALCNKRLLADLSRAWPRSMKSPQELAEQASKKINAGILALSEVLKKGQLNENEREVMTQALDTLGAALRREEAI